VYVQKNIAYPMCVCMGIKLVCSSATQGAAYEMRCKVWQCVWNNKRDAARRVCVLKLCSFFKYFISYFLYELRYFLINSCVIGLNWSDLSKSVMFTQCIDEKIGYIVRSDDNFPFCTVLKKVCIE